MSKIVKTAITQITNGDTVNPANANLPHTNLETNIDALIAYIAGSTAGAFDYDAATSSGLTFEYTTGVVNFTTPVVVSAGSVILTGTSTNYVEINTSNVVVTNATGWNEDNIPLWEVTTNASNITGALDKRTQFSKQSQAGQISIVDSGGLYTSTYVEGALQEVVTLTNTQTITGAKTFQSFTSTGIDDNATSVAITIDATERVMIGATVASVGSPLEVTANTAGQGMSILGRAADNFTKLEFHQNALATVTASFHAITGSLKTYIGITEITDVTASGLNVTGDITCAALTSTGIDDNATATVSTFTDSVLDLGKSGSSYGIVRDVDDQLLIVSGGWANNTGANILFYGGTHANTGDMVFRNDANTFMTWKELSGSLTMSSGVGAKSTALTLGASGNALFANHIYITSTNRLYLDGGSNTYIQEGSADKIEVVTGGIVALTLDSSQDATFAGNAVTQNLGVGTSTINKGGWSNAVTVQGSSWAALELVSDRADAENQFAAIPTYRESNSTGHENVTMIDFLTEGATINQRGGMIRFRTKPNGTTSLITALTLDSSQNATFAGAVVCTTFTSTGIDDNATAEVLQIGDDVSSFSGGDVYVIDLDNNPLLLVGDSSSAGQYGGLRWNSSANELRLFGQSSNESQLVLDSSGDATFTGNVTINGGTGSELNIEGTSPEINFYRDGVVSTYRDWSIRSSEAVEGSLSIYTGTAVGLDPTIEVLRLDSSYDATFAGIVTSTGINMQDSQQIRLGNSNDLDIYHDGITTSVLDITTGHTLSLTMNNSAETLAKFIGNGAVELYYDNTKTFETVSGGVSVTGEMASTTIKLGGTALTTTAEEINKLDISANTYAAWDTDIKAATSGSCTTSDYTSNSNWYYRVGNIVMCSFAIKFRRETMVGDLYITLPYTSARTCWGASFTMTDGEGNINLDSVICPDPVGGSLYFRLSRPTILNAVVIKGTDISTSQDCGMIGSFMYYTEAAF